VGVYAVKRVVWTGALFLALATVTFVLFFVVPHGNQAPGRRRAGLTPRPPLDIHGSLVHEYGQFLSRIAHGALGTSSVNGHSVTTILTTAAPITAGLVLGGAVIWMLIAVPLGLLSALRPRSLTAKAGGAFTLIGLSVHPLWLGLVLSWVFGDQLGWFPSGGYCDTLGPRPDCGGPIPWAYHMALPWAAFALLYGAYYVRLIRVNASGALQEDYVRTARAKGVSDWGVLRSHVLAATMRPILTALVLDVGGLAMGTFGAAIFVETAFGIPGLGRTAAQSFQRRDLPVIIGVLLFVTATVVVANLIADLAAAALDPRVRRRAAPV
jgi:peptide/nickel transport system permease protein